MHNERPCMSVSADLLGPMVNVDLHNSCRCTLVAICFFFLFLVFSSFQSLEALLVVSSVQNHYDSVEQLDSASTDALEGNSLCSQDGVCTYPGQKKTETTTQTGVQARALSSMHASVVWQTWLSQFFSPGQFFLLFGVPSPKMHLHMHWSTFLTQKFFGSHSVISCYSISIFFFGGG